MSHDANLAKHFARFTENDDATKTIVDNYIDASPDPRQFRLFLAEFGAATGAIFTLPLRAMGVVRTEGDHDNVDNPFISSANSTRSQHIVLVRTPNFMPAGAVWVERVYNRAKGAEELTFNYRAPHIVKERAKHGQKNIRTSTKVKSMLTAMKKSGEYPTEELIARPYIEEIKNSLNYSLARGITEPRVSLSSDVQMDLMLGVAVDGHGLKSETLSETLRAYNEYIKSVASMNEKKRTLNRYRDGGFWAIGIAPNSIATRPIYYVIEMQKSESLVGIEATNGLFRHMTSLESIEPVHMALMFAKPFFEKKFGQQRTTPYFLPRTDEYFEEVDIGVGYQRDVTWVFVPKVSE